MRRAALISAFLASGCLSYDVHSDASRPGDAATASQDGATSQDGAAPIDQGVSSQDASIPDLSTTSPVDLAGPFPVLTSKLVGTENHAASSTTVSVPGGPVGDTVLFGVFANSVAGFTLPAQCTGTSDAHVEITATNAYDLIWCAHVWTQNDPSSIVVKSSASNTRGFAFRFGGSFHVVFGTPTIVNTNADSIAVPGTKANDAVVVLAAPQPYANITNITWVDDNGFSVLTPTNAPVLWQMNNTTLTSDSSFGFGLNPYTGSSTDKLFPYYGVAAVFTP